MDFDVVVVGASLVGGSLAAALGRNGVRVGLIDARELASQYANSKKPLSFDQRIYALRPGNIRFLDVCGIWQWIDAARIAPVHKMLVTGDDGVSRLTFDAYRSHLSELAVILESSNLQAAIDRTVVESPMVTRLTREACVGIEWKTDGVITLTDSGKQVRSRLVVAADGARSRVREFAGIATKYSPYGQHGVVANFETQLPSAGTAWQWFRPDGVLALLPLPEKMISMVWSTTENHAKDLMGLDRQTLAMRVGEASGCVLGEFEQIGATAAFPLGLMRAERVVGARLALVGDAAHNVHPLAGQGLNLGLADVKALSDAIAARGQEDIGSDVVLAKYRRSRAEETLAMQFATDGLHHLFQSSLPGVAWLRNAGLRLTEHLLPLKRMLVKQAAG